MLLASATEVFRRISHAAMRAGRNPEEVKLVAVTKTVSSDRIREAIDLGLRIFGESRVQEAEKKILSEELKGDRHLLQWHFIGHLQVNKAKTAVQLFDLIHSVDSQHLASEVDGRAGQLGKVQRVLLQVKLADEPAKHGVPEEGVGELIRSVSRLKHVRLEGLMAIPPFAADAERSRDYYRRLACLRDRLQGEGFHLPELSMGMSHDYQVAVEEGATLVRVGTAIFGERSV